VMCARVLITPRSLTKGGHPSLDRLRAAGCEVMFCAAGKSPTEEELVGLLPGCAGWLAGVEPISARALEVARGLKVISRNGTGVDNIDLAAAERLGIRIRRAEGANARGVGELAIGLMLALARTIPASDRAIKDGRWERQTGFEMEGKTLGVIGAGRIGRLVAKMAAGLDMRVVAHDVVPAAGLTMLPLEEVFAVADVISLHCPPRPDGRAVVDAAALARMKRGALLVNTARAGLLDETAVLAALESGQLGGLASDVLEGEPPANRRLAEHPRVVVTPHAGALTRESVDRAVSIAVDNLLDELQKTPASS
jgi:phosphoglycerate dehydrogenase-like enzyme